MEDFLKSETQAISVADLLWLIYIFVYNICTCARLSDPPREVSFNLLKSRYAFFYQCYPSFIVFLRSK